MKRILLVRHAKSSWDHADMKDFDRPLNDRGKKNAPEMAQRLLQRDISIDAFVSSPAKRAFSTARIFAAAYGKDKHDIITQSSLYLADAATLENVISHLDDEQDTVALFAHNPGITDFASSQTNVRIDNMPTCGVFGITVHSDQWSAYGAAEKAFWFFDYPKNPAG